MAQEEILSQEEIDALMHGVESGTVNTENDHYRLRDGVAREVDLTAHERIVRGRMPTLEMINNRFARNLRVGLFNLLHRGVDVSFQGVKLVKFAEYLRTLSLPTSLNTIRVPPLRGNGLFVLDSKLVFSLVETYFGGDGRYYTRIEGREFTAMENRVIQMTLDRCFADMRDAWAALMPVEFEYVSSEVNPQFANIVSPTEIVVVATFQLTVDDIGGELHITLPYAMVEPIRDLLDAGVQSDRDARDDRWASSIREEVDQADIELHATLLETEITLGKLLSLKPGDVIPIELPEDVVLCAEGVPLYRGQFGTSNGSNAIKLESRIAQRAPRAGLAIRKAIGQKDASAQPKDPNRTLEAQA